jgi:subtilase-type serine protease
MNAQFAYARGFTGKGSKLGAVDSGLNSSNPEFSTRQVDGITLNLVSNEGTYLDDGANIPNPLTQPWSAGSSFSVTGEYITSENDDHGSHVSGTIAAARNGTTKNPNGSFRGMMGVAFNSSYYLSNSNGKDTAIYGPNVDYNFFKAAYEILAKQNVRAINSSWGSPGLTSATKTIPQIATIYSRYFLLAGKKTWLQGVAEVTRNNPVLQVFAAGNSRNANVNIRSALPFFEPDLESRWITVPATDKNDALASFSNQCGLAKYWCISAPGNFIKSIVASAPNVYPELSGTSMAAPHVTGALGLLMERYPSLSNEAIRTILLSTAKHLGTGDPEVPDIKFGWGISDLNKAMSGPGQLLGTFEATLAAGISDEWSNPITQAAMQQRKLDEADEIAAWPANKASLLSGRKQESSASPPADWVANIANLLDLMTKMVQAQQTADSKAITSNRNALRASPYGERMYQQLILNYTDSTNSWTMARLNALTGGLTGSELVNHFIKMENDVIETAATAWEKRIETLKAKTDADYASNLIKSGAGILSLSGANTYTGSTEVREGTLKTGVVTALANSPVKVAAGATLDITSSGNAAVAGIVNAGTITLSDGVTGQVLNVNGPWDGQQGIVKLDTIQWFLSPL